ncbi:MAG: nucleotidyl transferase AbiEii/AbiGii toxin family protein [Kiritimatiellia bacterium]|jgi:predicted nucleotidyltransferase component of viral defense system
MIPQAYIEEWFRQAPWPLPVMVEQDLIISRALVAVFSEETIARGLVFRGGTAIHKLHLASAARYSEDIDLVQGAPEPIGPIIDAIRVVLDPLLGTPQRKFGRGLVTIMYRMESEGAPAVPMRLKIEINSREHFALLGIMRKPFAVESSWFRGACEIPTFRMEELLGSKLRALYQRRKGRDLFDLWLGLTVGEADPVLVVRCFRRFLEAQGVRISAAEFRQNLAAKLSDPVFLADMAQLLRPGQVFDISAAHELVLTRLVDALERSDKEG